MAEVADAEGPVAHVGDDQVVELRDSLETSHGADDELAAGLIKTPSRELQVLLLDRAPDLTDREPLRGQAVGVDPDVDGSLLPSDQDHLPDTRERLDVLLHLLAGDLGHLTQVPFARDGDPEHRNRVHVELLDHRGIGADR